MSGETLAPISCGWAECPLGTEAPAVSDISHVFLRCVACGVLRIPPEHVVDTTVDPDAPGLGLAMRLLLGLRRIWLSIAVPEFRDRDRRVLDVGCGDGQFLCVLRKSGRPVAGVETNPDRAARARQAGLDVHPDLDAAAGGGPYGLIFLWHVVEHLERPVASLRRCAGLLADSGVVIVSVPNHASLQTRAFGRYASFPDYGRHLWYHAPGYISWLTKALPGCKISRVPDLNLEYELFCWVDSLAAATVRRTNFVHRVFKKGEGGGGRRIAALGLAAIYVVPALFLSVLSLMLPGRASTLTFAIRRR